MLEQYFANNYVRAGVIFVGLLFLLKIFAAIVERVILRMVRKTKTDLDDILLEKSSFPVTLLMFFISLNIAIKELGLAGSLSKNINSFIYSGIVIAVGILIYAIVDVIVFRAWTKVARKAKIGASESLASLIHGILKVVVIFLIFLYILDLWGVEIAPLLAGLGLAGLAVALALQPTLSNIFSGVAMIMDKSVRVGDLVYLDASTKGKIKKIGLRSTRIVTFDNELIIVPNSKLADSTIQNVALPEPKTRAVVPFSVAYGSDINKVKKLIFDQIKTIDHVLPDPVPVVRFVEMADSSLNFKAYYYVDSFENRFGTIDEANTRIYNILGKHKIDIPFPQRDVHLKRK
ncbi:mechanosensitive ion channel [Candidatus Pacearchaeota archaeon]|nr:mechanosensitive ion channel [Candidatus Pacearchaeota archaeon]